MSFAVTPFDFRRPFRAKSAYVDPTLRNALIGAGGGALLTGGLGAIDGFLYPGHEVEVTPTGDVKRTRRNRAAAALQQALKAVPSGLATGALVGGGLTEAARALPNITIPAGVAHEIRNLKPSGLKFVDDAQRAAMALAGEAALRAYRSLSRKEQFGTIGTPFHSLSHPLAGRIFGNW